MAIMITDMTDLFVYHTQSCNESAALSCRDPSQLSSRHLSVAGSICPLVTVSVGRQEVGIYNQVLAIC
jgi:hypothetical protein